MRFLGIALTFTLVFILAFFVVAIGCNFFVAKHPSRMAVYLSIFVPPIAASCAFLSVAKKLQKTKKPTVYVFLVSLFIILSAVVMGFIFIDLERNVFNNVATGIVFIGTIEGLRLFAVSCALTLVSVWLLARRTIQRARCITNQTP